MDEQLTPDQINAMIGMNKMTPNQSKSALGSANGFLQKAITFGENQLPTVGAIAGGIGGAAIGGLAGIETGPGALGTAYAGGVAGAGIGGAAGEAGKEALQGQSLNAGSIALAGGENAAFDAVGGPLLGAGGKLLGKLSETAGGLMTGAAKLFGAGLDPTAAQTAKATLEAVAPKMTAKETAQAIADRGGTKTGILGKIKANIDPELKNVAAAVQKYVPDFNPKATFTENVNATRTAVYKMADDLKQQVVSSGKDIIYPFKELASRMDSVEKPIEIKADATLDKKFDLAKDAAMKIAKKSGGKISNLLDARKEFDKLVQKEFPTLYEKANAPMRSAITAMRNAMNDTIAEALPDVEYKDSLKAQSQLFTAIDNMSEKAAGEVGTNVIDRATSAIKKHPVISTLGAGALLDQAKKIPIIGDLIP